MVALRYRTPSSRWYRRLGGLPVDRPELLTLLVTQFVTMAGR
jgi:hypothetical protein